MDNPLVSKHLIRRDLERDPDHINQMLWKRKLYKKRIARNQVKKTRKHYFQTKEELAPEQVEEKQDKFYKQLFEKVEGETVQTKKKKKKKSKAIEVENEKKEEIKEETTPKKHGSFNNELERIKKFREDKAREREEREKAKQKQIKKKLKYAKKLNRKTDKGQPLMKNMISHYLSKIEKGA